MAKEKLEDEYLIDMKWYNKLSNNMNKEVRDYNFRWEFIVTNFFLFMLFDSLLYHFHRKLGNIF